MAARLGHGLSPLAAADRSHRGRPAERFPGIHLRAGGGGAWDRQRDRRLSSQARADPAAGAAGQDRRQRDHHRHGRLGRSRRADRADRGRLRLAPGKPLAAERRRSADPHGGRHGRGHRRHLPRTPGRRLFAAEVLYRSPEFEPEVIMPAAIASVVSVLHLRPVHGLGTAVQHAQSDLRQSAAIGAVPALGVLHDRAGLALYAHVLRHGPPLPPAARASPFPARRSGPS